MDKILEKLEKEMSEKLEEFQEKLKILKINNKDKEILKNIKLKNKDDLIKLEDICFLKNDEKGNIIITPFKKNDIENIEHYIKKKLRNESIIINKKEIKIITKKTVSKEEIEELKKEIKKEKEKFKIILRNIRKNTRRNNLEKEKEIQKITDKNINKLEEMYNIKIKNIK